MPKSVIDLFRDRYGDPGFGAWDELRHEVNTGIFFEAMDGAMPPASMRLARRRNVGSSMIEDQLSDDLRDGNV